jgi:hypothetical protein
MRRTHYFSSSIFHRLWDHTKIKCVACVALCDTMYDTLKYDTRCSLRHISSSGCTTHFSATHATHSENVVRIYFSAHQSFFSKNSKNYYCFSWILITKPIMGDPDGKIYPSRVDWISIRPPQGSPFSINLSPCSRIMINREIIWKKIYANV